MDRNFRDIKGALEYKGFEVLILAFKGKHAQLTTDKSIETHLHTKTRWVVETIHGCIAQKLFLIHI